MYFENDTFDVEIYCKICSSDNVDLTYDLDRECVNVKCNKCGNNDTLYFSEE